MPFIRTAMLIGFLTALFLGVGYLIGGASGIVIAFVLALLMNAVSYWFSDKIVLAIYGAKPSSDRRLNYIVERVAKNAGIPLPKVYIIPTPSPNAFATGRNKNHAAVAATEGILRLLNDDELEGVFSHEIGHVKNRDILVSSIAATVAGALSYLAQFAWYGFGNRDNKNSLLMIPALILAPLAAMLVQMAISRTREYGADYTGAFISKKPLALASALQKISSASTTHPLQGPPATAHLFIVNPFSGASLFKLFSTHPPVEERVKRLKELHKQIK